MPEHAHSENGLLKRKAADVENEIIGRMATAPGVTTKKVLTEISSNLQKTKNGGNNASIISSMRSANAIKLALYRKKAKVNPAPHIPKTYDDIINATLSAKYTQTHDGAAFL